MLQGSLSERQRDLSADCPVHFKGYRITQTPLPEVQIHCVVKIMQPASQIIAPFITLLSYYNKASP